jgi:site-specific recombinase XerD
MTIHQTTALVPIAPALPSTLALDVEKASALAREEKAKGTRKLYATDFRIWTAWCAQRGASALPATAESVAAFLACQFEQGISPSTLGHRIAAIRYFHKIGGYDPPTDDERVKATMRGARRVVGTAPTRKAPATSERVISMAIGSGDWLKDLRDRAVLLLGFAGAFRRSELVALNVEDLEADAAGLKIYIRHSKTDQEGHGATIAVVRGSIACPVAALRLWLEAAAITAGPVFRAVKKGSRLGDRLSSHGVAAVVKAHARRVGLDPLLFSGHSLRSGFLTSAAKRGASIFKMMDVSRHKSVDTLRGYVRDAELFQDHAGAGLL